MKTIHQLRVEDFMIKAGQNVPDFPTEIITPEERHLRAKLILEEALETINGLGVKIVVRPPIIANDNAALEFESCDFYIEKHYNIIEIIDGCCDIKVVTTGTLSAFGLPDENFQEIVDIWNLKKFGPGSYRNANGKWIKPPDFKGPNDDITAELADLTTKPTEYPTMKELKKL